MTGRWWDAERRERGRGSWPWRPEADWWPARPEVELGDIAIDSRRIRPGDVFLAIRGERLDGHEFIAEALRKGAAGVIVGGGTAAPVTGADGLAPVTIVVDDTIRALQSIARDVRRRSGTQVVAITGSVGKTTTKELTASFVGTRHDVVRNEGNLNNHIGLPLSLLATPAAPGRRGGRAGHEPRRRDPHAGRHCRAGRPGLDQRGGGPCGVVRLD